MGLYDQFQFRETQPISTYVGLPIDEAVRASEKLEDKYYTNLAARNSIDIALGTFDTIEGDRPGYESITSDIRQGLQEMAKRGDYENMGAKVSALATKFAADPRLHSMRKSYENYQKYMEDKTRFGAQGLDFAPKDFKSWDPETGKTQVFEGYVQERLPWEQEQAQIVDQLTPDSIFEDELHRLKGDFPGWLYTEQGQALTADKVRRYIDEQGGLDRYKDTASYKQQRAYMLHQLQQQGVEPTDEILQQFDEGIRDRLVATGMERVFSQTQKRFMQDPAYLAKLKAGLESTSQYIEASPFANEGRGLINSGWDPATKQMVGGVQATTEDLLNEGFTKATIGGKTMVSTPGDIIFNPGVEDPLIKENVRKAQEAMEKVGGPGSEAIYNYTTNKSNIENSIAELPDITSDLAYKAEQARLAGDINDVAYNNIMNYYVNIDPSNIESWKEPWKDIGWDTEGADALFRQSTALKNATFPGDAGAELGESLKIAHDTLTGLRESTRYVSDKDNIAKYEYSKKRADPDVIATLEEYSEYLGPQYQESSAIGQRLNNMNVVGEPALGNNTVRLEDGTVVTKMTATLTKGQWNSLSGAEQKMIKSTGNLGREETDEDGVTISYYVPRKSSNASQIKFDKALMEGKQKDPEQIARIQTDRANRTYAENTYNMLSKSDMRKEHQDAYLAARSLVDYAQEVSPRSALLAREILKVVEAVSKQPDSWDEFAELVKSGQLQQDLINKVTGQ